MAPLIPEPEERFCVNCRAVGGKPFPFEAFVLVPRKDVPGEGGQKVLKARFPLLCLAQKRVFLKGGGAKETGALSLKKGCVPI